MTKRACIFIFYNALFMWDHLCTYYKYALMKISEARNGQNHSGIKLHLQKGTWSYPKVSTLHILYKLINGNHLDLHVSIIDHYYRFPIALSASDTSTQGIDKSFPFFSYIVQSISSLFKLSHLKALPKNPNFLLCLSKFLSLPSLKCLNHLPLLNKCWTPKKK